MALSTNPNLPSDDQIDEMSVIIALRDFADKQDLDKKMTMQELENYLAGLTTGNWRILKDRSAQAYAEAQKSTDNSHSANSDHENFLAGLNTGNWRRFKVHPPKSYTDAQKNTENTRSAASDFAAAKGQVASETDSYNSTFGGTFNDAAGIKNDGFTGSDQSGDTLDTFQTFTPNTAPLKPMADWPGLSVSDTGSAYPFGSGFPQATDISSKKHSHGQSSGLMSARPKSAHHYQHPDHILQILLKETGSGGLGGGSPQGTLLLPSAALTSQALIQDMITGLKQLKRENEDFIKARGNSKDKDCQARIKYIPKIITYLERSLKNRGVIHRHNAGFLNAQKVADMLKQCKICCVRAGGGTSDQARRSTSKTLDQTEAMKYFINRFEKKHSRISPDNKVFFLKKFFNQKVLNLGSARQLVWSDFDGWANSYQYYVKKELDDRKFDLDLTIHISNDISKREKNHHKIKLRSLLSLVAKTINIQNSGGDPPWARGIYCWETVDEYWRRFSDSIYSAPVWSIGSYEWASDIRGYLSAYGLTKTTFKYEDRNGHFSFGS